MIVSVRDDNEDISYWWLRTQMVNEEIKLPPNDVHHCWHNSDEDEDDNEESIPMPLAPWLLR